MSPGSLVSTPIIIKVDVEDKATLKLKKLANTLSILGTKLRAIGKNFQGWAMSIMFFGMLIQRIFTGIAKGAIKSFMKITEGVTENGRAINTLVVLWEYLKFVVGNAIATALQPFMGLLISWIMKFKELIETHSKLVGWLVIIGIAVGVVLFTVGTLVLGIVNGLIPALGYIITGIGFLISIFGWWLIPIIAVILLFVIFRKQIFAAVMWVWNKMKDFLKWLWSKVKPVLTIVVILFIQAFDKIKDALSSAWDWMVGIFTKAWAWIVKIKEGLLKIGSKVGGAIKGAINKVTGKKQFGGTIPNTGYYHLEAGEKVISNQEQNSTNFGNVTINVSGGGQNPNAIADEIFNKIKRMVSTRNPSQVF